MSNKTNAIIGDRVECSDSLISAKGIIVDINENGDILLKADEENKIDGGDEFMIDEKSIMKQFPDFDIVSFDLNVPYYTFGRQSIK